MGSSGERGGVAGGGAPRAAAAAGTLMGRPDGAEAGIGDPGATSIAESRSAA
jgi:hypothetical protein